MITILKKNIKDQKSKKLSRRDFSKLVLGAGLTASGSVSIADELLNFNWLPNSLTNTLDKSEDGTLICSSQGSDTTGVSFECINPIKNITIPVNFRGHGLNQHPTKKQFIVMMARRPGTLGIVLNMTNGELENTFFSQTDHHMHGHACYSADGLFLYTTESNFKTGEGFIVVRETRHYQIVSAFSSGGIGPHELAFMPDNKTLVVANGGLLTHPDSDRKILNLKSMKSNLSYIDTTSGELINSFSLKHPIIDFSKASIRHLDVAENGTVAIALQVQRSAMEHKQLVPLAILHKPGKPLAILNAPEQLIRKLNDYMGSVKINLKNKIAAFTSPKGDIAMFWDTDSLAFKDFHIFHDVCGLSTSNNQEYFIISNSSGKIRYIDSKTLQEDKDKRLNYPGKNWDNHLLSATRT
ncbi:MAG: hypothetical protein ACJAYK_001664 [Crocinitomicaceae bacterium]|jgi:hypothetical protein